MRRPALCLLALLAALTGCTAGPSDEPAGSPTTPTAHSVTPAADGPLRLTDTGSVCMERQREDERDYVDAGTHYHPDADVTLRSVRLVGAQDTRLVEGVVVPSGKVPLDGYFRGWPLPRRTLERDFPRWSERQPLAGAHLLGDRSYGVLLHVRAKGHRVDGGYRALRVTYDAGGTTYTTDLRVALLLRRVCR